MLEGLTPHWSRFKVGDEVWIVRRFVDQHVAELSTLDIVSFDEHEGPRYQHDTYNEHEESDCFPTEAEALAECERRNSLVTPAPSCSCYPYATEPNENCLIHGGPDERFCPYCGQIRSLKAPCKRCGCVYGIVTPKGDKSE